MFLKEYSICPKITISIDYNPVALSFIPFDVPVNQMWVQLNPCSTYQWEPWWNWCLQGSSRKQEQIIDIKNCINFQDYWSWWALEVGLSVIRSFFECFIIYLMLLVEFIFTPSEMCPFLYT